MQLFYWENQIPISAPNNIAVLNLKLGKSLWIEIFIVLRMRMFQYIITNIDNLLGIVVEIQQHRQIADRLGINYIERLHFDFRFIFLVILVLLILCFQTKNLTHLLMMFL